MNKGLMIGAGMLTVLLLSKTTISSDKKTGASVSSGLGDNGAGSYRNPSFDTAISGSAFAVYRDNTSIFKDTKNLLKGASYPGAKALYGWASAEEVGNVMQYLDQRFAVEDAKLTLAQRVARNRKPVTAQQAALAIYANHGAPGDFYTSDAESVAYAQDQIVAANAHHLVMSSQ